MGEAVGEVDGVAVGKTLGETLGETVSEMVMMSILVLEPVKEHLSMAARVPTAGMQEDFCTTTSLQPVEPVKEYLSMSASKPVIGRVYRASTARRMPHSRSIRTGRESAYA